MIAISRLMDNRHHPFDVIFGSILGMLLAWMAYRQYFPSLSRAECGRPYSIAEFATEKDERATTSGYQSARYPSQSPDLEMGARQRLRRKDIPSGRYRDEGETDTEDESRRGKIPTDDTQGYGGIPEGSHTVQSGFENTEYR
jgi:hypothetical protein